jgi:hypothetical protein
VVAVDLHLIRRVLLSGGVVLLAAGLAALVVFVATTHASPAGRVSARSAPADTTDTTDTSDTSDTTDTVVSDTTTVSETTVSTTDPVTTVTTTVPGTTVTTTVPGTTVTTTVPTTVTHQPTTVTRTATATDSTTDTTRTDTSVSTATSTVTGPGATTTSTVTTPAAGTPVSRSRGAKGYIGALMSWTFSFTRSYTTVKALAATGLSSGVAIHVTCDGRGCGFHRQVRRITRRCRRTSSGRRTCATPHSIGLQRMFRRRRLGVGTRIVITITRPHWIGKYYRWKIRAGRVPTSSEACLAPGASRPAAGC